jgi:hypothetical protein
MGELLGPPMLLWCGHWKSDIEDNVTPMKHSQCPAAQPHSQSIIAWSVLCRWSFLRLWGVPGGAWPQCRQLGVHLGVGASQPWWVLLVVWPGWEPWLAMLRSVLLRQKITTQGYSLLLACYKQRL